MAPRTRKERTPRRKAKPGRTGATVSKMADERRARAIVEVSKESPVLRWACSVTASLIESQGEEAGRAFAAAWRRCADLAAPVDEWAAEATARAFNP